MKIMKKMAIYTAVIIAIGLGLLFLLKKTGEPKEPPGMVIQSDAQRTNALKLKQNISVEATPQIAPMQSASVPIPIPKDATQSTTGSLSNAIQNWSTQIHRPIEFYGRVVDENNQPIEGAGVEFVWTHFAPLAEETPKTNTISDYNGNFSITGVIGANLGVYVGKNGYYNVKALNQNDFSYSTLPGMTPFQSDPNNPVIFHLRKKGSGADLISANLNPKISLDGTPIWVDLLAAKTGENGQLKISQIKPTYLEAKQAKEWSFTMSIPSGGFVEEDDAFPFEAPEYGYQPVIEFKFNKGETIWATLLKKSYYIAFGQPPRYGWLTVETDIGWGGARLHYAINPDGSRYLEPKEIMPTRTGPTPPPGVREVIPDMSQ
jgi:hypothetical protein